MGILILFKITTRTVAEITMDTNSFRRDI